MIHSKRNHQTMTAMRSERRGEREREREREKERERERERGRRQDARRSALSGRERESRSARGGETAFETRARPDTRAWEGETVMHIRRAGVLTSRQPPDVQLSGSGYNQIRPLVLSYRVARWRTRDARLIVLVGREAAGERFLRRGYWQTVAALRGHVYHCHTSGVSISRACIYRRALP